MKRDWSARIVIKYALLQLPAFALLVIILLLLRQWKDISLWLAWGLVALWVVKDIIIFRFVWRAYDQSRPGDITSMIGMQGIAKERLAPSGYVQVRGELWQAEIMEGNHPIEKDTRVRVMEIHGLTLLVQPVDEEHTD